MIVRLEKRERALCRAGLGRPLYAVPALIKTRALYRTARAARARVDLRDREGERRIVFHTIMKLKRMLASGVCRDEVNDASEGERGGL